MNSYEVIFKSKGKSADWCQFVVTASSITRAVTAGKHSLEIAVGPRSAKSYVAFLVREITSEAA